MSSFSWDSGSVQRAIQQEADSGLRKLTAEVQRELERLRPMYVGLPAHKIKPAVQAVWARHFDGSLPDEHLAALAEAISTGQPVEIRFGGLT